MLWILLACYSQDTFTAEWNQARCTTYERCDDLGGLGYSDVDACVTAHDGWSEQDDVCKDFDASAARECVEGWEQLACDALASDHPAACESWCLDRTADTAQ
jgi:hypothetical protein